MHQFWETDKMIRLVTSDLKGRCRALASVVALACCSKRLSDIALDAVWEELEDQGQLMTCLPSDTWEIRNDEFVFLRCPSTEEWVRFSSYARRVRKLRAYGDIPLAAYHMLSMQTPTLGQHLLPNLHTIDWCISSWDLLPFSRLFLNPGLVSVTIEFPDSNQHIYRPATISLIPTRDLTHLQLISMTNDSSMNALCNLLDKASETLRSIYLDGKSSIAVIEKLLQLPHLCYLGVELPETRISSPAVVFPSLERLTVDYKEPGSWLYVLRNIPNPKLQELTVYFEGFSPAHLQALGSSLLTANLERTLTSLECHRGGIHLTEVRLRPFLSFGRLTTLILPSSCTGERCGFQLNDSIISELAAGLPQLVKLWLGSSPCEVPTSDVTVASLAALSTNCVDLDSLMLHFNVRDIISRDTYANSQPHTFTCKLRTLSVGSMPLPSDHNDILFITFTILHIFPHLETVPSAKGSWDQVKQTVQSFRKAARIVPPPTAYQSIFRRNADVGPVESGSHM